MKNIPAILFSAILVLSLSGAAAAQKTKTDPNSQDRDLKQKSGAETNSEETETPETTTAKPPKSNDAKVTKKDSAPRKKVIAVSNFYNAVIGNEEPQIGRQLTALFTDEFTRNKTYSVAATQQIEEILQAQDKTHDERMDAQTAAKIGKIASANAFVFGDIIEFTLTDGGFDAGQYGSKTSFVATLGLVISLVDVNTGVTLKSVNVEETAEESSTKVIGIGKKLTMTPDLRKKLFTKAAKKAVKSAVEQLSPIIQNNDSQSYATNNAVAETPSKKDSKSAAPSVSTTREISAPKEAAKVTRMIKEVVYLSGLGGGAKKGDLFSVVRDGKEIAVLELTEVNENTAKAKIIEGAGVKADDAVKPLQ